jgi:cardiolipin synthase
MIRLSLPFAVLVLFSLAECATIPDAKELSTGPSGKTPAIQGPNHPHSSAQDAQAMQSVACFPGDDEKRQVAVEGEAAGTPLVAGNTIKLVQNWRPTYDLKEQAILSAKTNISAEFYTIEGVSIGTALTGLLIEQHRQGVAVEVICDSFGSQDTPTAFWNRLKAEGIPVLDIIRWMPPRPASATTQTTATIANA